MNTGVRLPLIIGCSPSVLGRKLKPEKGREAESNMSIAGIGWRRSMACLCEGLVQAESMGLHVRQMLAV